ncbi:pentapeptide repeat-containing protein [Streptomyces sp900116325]|uniref:Pentapeptide repeat-containing protein n=1 Tax=Streptomyces sp. 900116325 TaxID=3154295 RepID=A0ABV2UL56_9ACTN
MASTSAPDVPDWPYCGDGVTNGDRVGCIGRSVDPHPACLAHLSGRDRDAHLASLNAGDDIDHRGTSFTGQLLTQLLNALSDPTTNHPRLGDARFESATFTDNADFESTNFTGDARFHLAMFTRNAWFESATFTREAQFDSVTFTGTAGFESVTFNGVARFHSATFNGAARFRLATFTGTADFESAAFAGIADFGSAMFTGIADFEAAGFTDDVDFGEAVFERAGELGPLVCGNTVLLSGTRFGGPVTLSIAARRLDCHRTRWESTAALRLRHADVDFAQAVFEYPLSIAAEQAHFRHSRGVRGSVVPEDLIVGTTGSGARIVSLRGVDAAHLVLADIELTQCQFTGTVHLDQIRLEGNCTFATVPARTQWRWLRPQRFTQRRTLAEEHYWRSRQPTAVPGWQQAIVDTSPTEHVGPAQLAPVYRALRKAFEDSKNEPDAADFYYGEMEMRRHDHDRPRAERALLAAYWALSGYGLRATRAVVWLLLAMTGTLLVMMLWGLPAYSWKPETVGSLSGRQVRLPTGKPDPVNPTNALQERLSSQRFEGSLRVVVNSVIFRSSDQDLTTTGTYTEMASRLTEPVLLGLAVLAIRGRIKR